ncbi:serine/threonine protein kinase [Penicillium vulpinum]|uniref:serine/threonine protein kinase n=1 Tax=Penicillium vulpinum TaxID=29845 RepID=UPI002547F4F7|nr:serine/threonine protein kinase [Penicillium vulpinum]KAJ5963460.1 serine/threonine protein kinase [Penicillium vulpinum]
MARFVYFPRASNVVDTPTGPCQARIKNVHQSLPIIASLFSYSSGRFLYNEAVRLQERHVLFNVAALKHAVASHFSHGKVAQISKMSEGGFNRTYTTASEVATLTFLRSKDIPVPKVYGWSLTPDNPVGIEYIVMECASGIAAAESNLFDISATNCQAFVEDIVAIDKKISDIPFASLGSLYFKNKTNDSDIYCIGSIAVYRFWHGQRAGVIRQNTCLLSRRRDSNRPRNSEKFGKPVEWFPYNLMFPGAASYHDYLALLRKYLAVAPYLLPKDFGNVSNRPAIRHPDTFKITSIIDWQYAVILPLSLIAGHPKMFQHSPPASLENLEPGTEPPEYAQMNTQEQAEIDYHLRISNISYRYRVSNSAVNKLHLGALRDSLVFLRQRRVEYSGRQWLGDPTTLRGALMYLNDIWDEVPGKDASPESPIRFSEEEVQDYEKTKECWATSGAIRDEFQISEDGWVHKDLYDHAVERNKPVGLEFMEGCTEEDLKKFKQGWPFHDHEEG